MGALVHWAVFSCVFWQNQTCISRSTGTANVHFQSPCQSAVLDLVWDPEMGMGVEDPVWLLMTGPTEGEVSKSFKVPLKCDFLGTFHQEISCLRKPGISITSLIFSTFFLNINEKISFLYNPLLLKLKSLKAAVYLLHCTRVIEGSQVSFQPGEQQKLVLHKWQAATNCLLFTPSP